MQFYALTNIRNKVTRFDNEMIKNGTDENIWEKNVEENVKIEDNDNPEITTTTITTATTGITKQKQQQNNNNNNN